MFRPSLFWKIFAASLVLILLTAVVFGTIAERRIVEDVNRETRDQLRTQVDLLHALVQDRLPSAHDPAWQASIRALGQRMSTRLTIVRADGLVLADSSKDPAAMGNHADRPEVRASLEQEYGESTRRSDTVQVPMVYVARALRAADGSVRAFVRCSLPLLYLDERLDGLRGILLGGAAFAVLLGLLVALLMARRLAQPLRGMREAAAAIAAGDLERRVEVTAADEVGDLGRSFNDMAQRLEAEVHTIRRDRQELRAILDGMVEGVIAVDDEERLLLINDAACSILRLEGRVHPGRPIQESLRAPMVAETMATALALDRIQTSVLRMPQDGRDRVVHVHASPLAAEGGARRGAVVVLHDITVREQIEAIRRDFIANASHELKTPIAAVRGLVETVLDDDAMPAATRGGFLERVLKQIRRLGDLVDEMLALSRLESDGASLARRPLDLRDCLREVVDDAQPLAREHSVTLGADLPDEGLNLRGESESLRRIAGNLIHNAVKYCGPGGTVHVVGRRRGAEVVLEVTDDGPGIPLEKQARIFERFYRVDEHRSREVGGTGLGLAIVKHLVQLHGGRIELESRPGQGSTFRVLLPAD